METLKYVEDTNTGDVWVMAGDRKLMHFDKEGNVNFPNNIVCFEPFLKALPKSTKKEVSDPEEEQPIC